MRARSALLLALPLLVLAGCGRAPVPGPRDPDRPAPAAVGQLLDPRVLDRAEPAAPGGSWTATVAAADYTPAPCGVSVHAGAPRSDATATWRKQAAVVQVRALTYPSAGQARAAAAALRRQVLACPSWIEPGAAAEEQALAVPGAVVARHVSRFGDDGRSEAGWAVLTCGTAMVSVLATRPGAGFDPGVDALVRAAAGSVAARAGG